MLVCLCDFLVRSPGGKLSKFSTQLKHRRGGSNSTLQAISAAKSHRKRVLHHCPGMCPQDLPISLLLLYEPLHQSSSNLTSRTATRVRVLTFRHVQQEGGVACSQANISTEGEYGASDYTIDARMKTMVPCKIHVSSQHTISLFYNLLHVHQANTTAFATFVSLEKTYFVM